MAEGTILHLVTVLMKLAGLLLLSSFLAPAVTSLPLLRPHADLPGAPETSSNILGSPGTTVELLGASGTPANLLGSPGTLADLLGAPGTPANLLPVFGTPAHHLWISFVVELLPLSGRSYMFLLLGSHTFDLVDYTHSTPAPDY